MAPEGQAATQVPQALQRALFTWLRFLCVVLDGAVGAELVAHAAAGAVVLVDLGEDRVDLELAARDAGQDARPPRRAPGPRCR